TKNTQGSAVVSIKLRSRQAAERENRIFTSSWAIGRRRYRTMDSLRAYDNTLPWTPEEIQAMLSIWADSTVQRELESSVRNEKVYLRISSELATMGFLRSAKQCREKVKKLKQEYRKLKDHNNRDGPDRKGGKWFNLMDSVLGNGNTIPASTTGGSVLNSAMAILEDMSSPSPTSEDSALTGDEPIVEVQIVGDEQPIAQAMPEVRSHSPMPIVTRTHPAVKRKRASCSSDDWKKIILESDQQYVGVLHKMLESETRYRKDELQMKREEIQLKRTDVQQMKEEATTSSAIQGQLVGVLGQIAELFKAKQSALHTCVSQGRNAQSSATSNTTGWESQRSRELHARPQSDTETGAVRHQSLTTESHEENRTREIQHIIKTETEESVVGQQRTDTAPVNLEPVRMQYEESQAHSTTQEAAAITMQQDILAAQQEQCRLMAENNSIQRTLVRAVSRSNRCMADLAKSIRSQTAVAAGVQDRIVQLLERQEWTNQLLTMKVMGVSSTSSQHPQEAKEGLLCRLLDPHQHIQVASLAS
ncbi:hypothetical protein AAFF_G00349990, partial [Aldrovandia affinis]